MNKTGLCVFACLDQPGRPGLDALGVGSGPVEWPSVPSNSLRRSFLERESLLRAL